MIPKMRTLESIMKTGVVAVVRAENEEQAIKIADACLQGGIHAIEITFTVPGAHKVIEILKEKFVNTPLVLGAGTVLDSETARIAILSGASYIVSPAFDEDTAKLCNRYQIPYMPGCMTLTEMIRAMEAGADVIKVFPGSVAGPDFIKAIKGPLPQAVLMPTGGVNLENTEQWIQNGCIAVGVGGDLTAGAKTGDYDLVKEKAKAYINKVQQARKNK